VTASRDPAQRQTSEAVTRPRNVATDRMRRETGALFTPEICSRSPKEVRRKT
jgi:hypothetical protein